MPSTETATVSSLRQELAAKIEKVLLVADEASLAVFTVKVYVGRTQVDDPGVTEAEAEELQELLRHAYRERQSVYMIDVTAYPKRTGMDFVVEATIKLHHGLYH